MFKYTTTTLNKLEEAFKEGGYIVRYEKGSFTAGYCILEHKKVVVVNKYFPLEARINCLVEIFGQVNIPKENLSAASLLLIGKLPQQNAES